MERGNLTAADIEISNVADGWEYRRVSDKKLLFKMLRVNLTGPVARLPNDKELIARAWNSAITEGMEIGRRHLQEELADLLGVKLG